MFSSMKALLHKVANKLDVTKKEHFDVGLLIFAMILFPNLVLIAFGIETREWFAVNAAAIVGGAIAALYISIWILRDGIGRKECSSSTINGVIAANLLGGFSVFAGSVGTYAGCVAFGLL